MLKQLWKMTTTEFKLYLREPAAAFFTLVFPLIILFVFGAIFGNDPYPDADVGTVDVSTPGYMAMVVGTVGLLSVPIGLATYRENGVLRRYQATPVNPLVIVAAQVLVNLLMMALGVALLLIAARVVYGLQLPQQPLGVLMAFLLAGLSFTAVGGALGIALPTSRTAQIVGNAVFFPMLFLSGAAIPLQAMPETVRQIAEVLPLTHVTLLITDLWFGDGWRLVSTIVLAGILVLATLVTSQILRWREA